MTCSGKASCSRDVFLLSCLSVIRFVIMPARSEITELRFQQEIADVLEVWMEPRRSSRGLQLMLKRLNPLRAASFLRQQSMGRRFRLSCPGPSNARCRRPLDIVSSLEWLEPRATVKRNAHLPIASMQPYNGQQLSQSPQELIVTFNGLNVPALMGNFDVQIEELNSDGTKTPLWDLGDAPPEQSDATGTELIVPLQKFSYGDFSYDNVTLPAGQYEIDLVGGTSISYAASGALRNGSAAMGPESGPRNWDIHHSEVKGQRWPRPPLWGSRPAGQTMWGSIDPNDPSSAVELYQFTLARRAFLAGRSCDFGLECWQPIAAGSIALRLERQPACDRNSGYWATEQSE